MRGAGVGGGGPCGGERGRCRGEGREAVRGERARVRRWEAVQQST